MQKTFTVDFNDLEQVSKLFNIVKCQYHVLKRNKDGLKPRKQRYTEALNLCWEIFNEDISDIYSKGAFSFEKKFYVYAHGFDSNLLKIGSSSKPKHVFAAQLGLQFIPVYIGKGCDERIKAKDRNLAYSHLKRQAKEFGANLLKFKIKDCLSESEALAIEGKLIDIFGLKINKGWLCNLDLGYFYAERHKRLNQKLSQMQNLL